jgi:hypothetical protein
MEVTTDKTNATITVANFMLLDVYYIQDTKPNFSGIIFTRST